MAENNEYHIYVYLNGEDKKSAVAGSGTGSTGADTSSGNLGEEKVVNKLKSLVSFAAIKSTADNLATGAISQVSLQTGASEYEQRLSFKYNVASQSLGAGAALLGAGIAGGPAGIAVAVIGLAASGLNRLISIQQKKETLQLQKDLENVSIGMARVRAGISGRREKNQ